MNWSVVNRDGIFVEFIEFVVKLLNKIDFVP